MEWHMSSIVVEICIISFVVILNRKDYAGKFQVAKLYNRGAICQIHIQLPQVSSSYVIQHCPHKLEWKNVQCIVGHMSRKLAFDF